MIIRVVLLAVLALGLSACGPGTDGDGGSVGRSVEETAHDDMDAARDAAAKMSQQAGETATRVGAAMKEAAGKAEDETKDAMDAAGDALAPKQ